MIGSTGTMLMQITKRKSTTHDVSEVEGTQLHTFSAPAQKYNDGPLLIHLDWAISHATSYPIGICKDLTSGCGLRLVGKILQMLIQQEQPRAHRLLLVISFLGSARADSRNCSFAVTCRGAKNQCRNHQQLKRFTDLPKGILARLR